MLDATKKEYSKIVIGQQYDKTSTKLVHNYSSHELTPTQVRLLQRGWEFYIKQRITNTINIKTDIEMNIAKLEELYHNSIHKKICQQVNNAATDMLYQLRRKSIKSLSEDERTALKDNNQIVICKADKGNGMVILDKSDYTSKMQIDFKLQTIHSHRKQSYQAKRSRNK